MITTIHTASGVSDAVEAERVQYRFDFNGAAGWAQLQVSRDEGETWVGGCKLRHGSMTDFVESYSGDETVLLWRIKVELAGGTITSHLDEVE